MGLNGYQLFVRAVDHKVVEKAIRKYVKKAGARGVVDPESDEMEAFLGNRGERKFVLSTVRNGQMAVWEDGSWADRALAQALSKTLGTRTVWLMVSDATDSWAYSVYESGKRVDHQHSEVDDPLAKAEGLARREHLPFALEYLEEPDREDADFTEELNKIGYFDDLEADRERIQHMLREALDDGEYGAASNADGEDDADVPNGGGQREVDRERANFVEFSVRTSA